MYSAILSVALAGLVLLTAATVYLCYLNWNEKIYGPLLSILLVGVSAAFASVFVTLKESKIESSFAAPIVIDEQEGFPPLIVSDQGKFKIVERLNNLHWLTTSSIFPDATGTINAVKLTDHEQWFSYCGELLQYELLQYIQTLQGGRISRFSEGVSKVTKATVTNPYRLSNTVAYDGKKLQSALTPNRFSKIQQQQLWWAHSSILLPPDTEIFLLHNQAFADKPANFILRFRKPRFFEIDFLIQPIAFADKGFLPPNVAVRPEVAGFIRTYHLHVIMTARFEKITAGNRDTEEYKAWAQWLFDNFKNQFNTD